MLKIMTLNSGEEFPANYSSLTAILKFTTTSVIEFVNSDYSSYQISFNSSQVVKLKNVHLRSIVCVSGQVQLLVVDKGEEVDIRYIG